MGLRAEKQRRQRADLIANAIALTFERGALPSIKAVAERSVVSEATVFNYFGHREALLAEWAWRELDRRVAAAAVEDAGSPRRVVRQVNRQLAVALAETPQVWLKVWAAASASDPAIGRPGGDGEGARLAGMTQLLQAGRDRGEARTDQLVADQAQLLAGAWLGALSREARAASSSARSDHDADSAADDASPPVDAAGWRRVEGTVEVVLDGLRKRHERVRVRSGSAGAGTSITPR
jgi:AcrR family transcriptional regulator